MDEGGSQLHVARSIRDPRLGLRVNVNSESTSSNIDVFFDTGHRVNGTANEIVDGLVEHKLDESLGDPVLGTSDQETHVIASRIVPNEVADTRFREHGEVVWVQTHSSFPFWPACVVDPHFLPSDTQSLATAALSRASPRMRKQSVYMYASAHFDFALPSQMKDYSTSRDVFAHQAADGSFAQLLPQAVALADKELLLDPNDRLSWVLQKSTTATAVLPVGIAAVDVPTESTTTEDVVLSVSSMIDTPISISTSESALIGTGAAAAAAAAADTGSTDDAREVDTYENIDTDIDTNIDAIIHASAGQCNTPSPSSLASLEEDQHHHRDTSDVTVATTDTYDAENVFSGTEEVAVRDSNDEEVLTDDEEVPIDYAEVVTDFTINNNNTTGVVEKEMEATIDDAAGGPTDSTVIAESSSEVSTVEEVVEYSYNHGNGNSGGNAVVGLNIEDQHAGGISTPIPTYSEQTHDEESDNGSIINIGSISIASAETDPETQMKLEPAGATAPPMPSSAPLVAAIAPVPHHIIRTRSSDQLQQKTAIADASHLFGSPSACVSVADPFHSNDNDPFGGRRDDESTISVSAAAAAPIPSSTGSRGFDNNPELPAGAGVGAVNRREDIVNTDMDGGAAASALDQTIAAAAAPSPPSSGLATNPGEDLMANTFMDRSSIIDTAASTDIGGAATATAVHSAVSTTVLTNNAAAASTVPAISGKPPLPLPAAANSTKVVKPVINRSGSASLFQGKAQVVTGASPFDSIPATPSPSSSSPFSSSLPTVSRSSSGGAAAASPSSFNPKVILNRSSSSSTGHPVAAAPFPGSIQSKNNARESAESVFSSVPAGLFGSASSTTTNNAAALFDSSSTASNAFSSHHSSAAAAAGGSFFGATAGGGSSGAAAAAASLNQNHQFTGTTRSSFDNGSITSSSSSFDKPQHPPAGATSSSSVFPSSSSSSFSSSAAAAAGFPPSAPGVRAPPSNSPAPNTAKPPMSSSNKFPAGHHPSPMSVPLPAGMIPTPHGYIPAAAPSASSSASSAPPTFQKNIASETKVMPGLTTLSEPNHAPTRIDQHSAAARHSQINSFVSSASAAATSRPASVVSAAQRPSANASAGRPPCPIVAFGFGGRVAVMIPKAKKPLNPLLVTPEDVAKPYAPGKIDTYRLIDLLQQQQQQQDSGNSPSSPSDTPTDAQKTTGGSNSTFSYSSHNRELSTTLELLSMFKGPLLLEKQGSSAKGPDDSAAVVMKNVKEQIAHRIDNPVTASFSDKFFNLHPQHHLSSSSHNEEDPAAIADVRVSNRSSRTSSEKLMWMLLRTIVDTNGAVTSSSPGSANSPESRIVRLLVDGPSSSTSQPPIDAATATASSSFPVTGDIRKAYSVLPAAAAGTSSGAAAVGKGEYCAAIECLLLAGRREEAASLAASNGEWALALLIASNCGQDKYQEICREYSAATLPLNSPLHLASMLFSNQASALIQHGGKRLSGGFSDGGSSGSHNISSSSGNNDTGSISSLWRRHLAMILSNKPADWQNLLHCLADRVLSETQDLMVAHFIFLCSGELPSAPSHTTTDTDGLPRAAHRYSILGCDAASPRHRAVADCLSLSALRMTEILEWALSRSSADSSVSATGSSSSSSLGKSLIGLFGLGGGGKLSVDSSQPQQSSSPTGSSISPTRLLHVRSVLCPLKLRLAYILADFGLVKEASAYAIEAKTVVQLCGAQGAPPTSKQQQQHPSSQGGNPVPEDSPRPFSKNFVYALDEFISRIDGLEGKFRSGSEVGRGSSAAATASNAPPETKGGGVSSGIRSVFDININLKGLVDGPDVSTRQQQQPQQHQQQQQGGAPGPFNANSTPSPTSFNNAPPAAIDHSNQRPAPYPGSSPFPYPQQQQPQQQQSRSSNSSYGDFVSVDLSGGGGGVGGGMLVPPAAPGSSVGGGGMPGIGFGSPYGSSYGPGSAVHGQGQSQGPPSNERGSSSSRDIDDANTKSSAVPTSTLSKAVSSISLSSTTASATAANAAAQSPSNSEKSGSNKSGFMGAIRKNMLKMMFPDAHDANENIGTGLGDAFFDKATNKWIFPGQENDAGPDPASLPPPTAIGLAPAPAAPGSGPGLGGRSALPAMGAPATTAGTPAEEPYDPLAALMAPPPNRMTSYGSQMFTAGSAAAGGSGPPSSSAGPSQNPFGLPPSTSSLNLSSTAARIDGPPMSSQGAVSNPFSMSAKMPPMYASLAPPASVGGAPISMWCPPTSAVTTQQPSVSIGDKGSTANQDVQDGAQPPVSFGFPSSST